MMPPMIAPPTSLPQLAWRPVGYGWPPITTVPPRPSFTVASKSLRARS